MKRINRLCRHFSFQQFGPLFFGFLSSEDKTCSP